MNHMSILAGNELLKEIKCGNIIITPLHESSIGPASVDLRLSYAIRVYKNIYNPIIDDKPNYKRYTDPVDLRKSDFMLMPGQGALGITIEKIELADTICDWLEGRSCFSRIGLLVHISASFMQPGINNHQVLELFNLGMNPIKLEEGIKVCQFIFQRIIGKARYSGQFKVQTPDDFINDL